MRNNTTTGEALAQIEEIPPDKIIRGEAGRQKIRAPLKEYQPVGIIDGRNVKHGPDTDALGPDFRFDGCHFSRRGADLVATLWFNALTGR
jgi:hypothetical protein